MAMEPLMPPRTGIETKIGQILRGRGIVDSRI
jgi:hypothetical protein